MRILVIEDNPRHQQAAVAVLKAAGHEVFLEASYDNVYRYMPRKDWDGTKVAAECPVDGVITDIYFPLRIREEGYDTDENPVGIAVAIRCQMWGIPFVLCTDYNHHAVKVQWILDLVGVTEWDLVGGVCEQCGDGLTTPYSSKNWTVALERLEYKVEAKEAAE